MNRRSSAATLVLTTVGSAKVGRRLASALVQSRSCACVSLLPGMRSVYRWKGELHADAEVLLLIKTVPGKVAQLRRTLEALHPYDVPELLFLDVTAAGSYLRWLQRETAANGP
jgi:periplasmic divalent cation tolerance protein